MMSSKNSGFTASDIDRYHSGKMSAEERHALEKAALDDPFLADALEGYALTPTAAADVAAIQARLDQRTNRTPVIPFYQKYRWLTAAAVLLIVAGIGWLVFSVSRNQKESFAAVNKQDHKPTDSNQVAVPNREFLDTQNQDSNATAENATVTAPPRDQSSASHLNSTASKKQNQAKHERADKEIETGVATSLASQSIAQNNVVSNNDISNNERTRLAKTLPPAEPRSNNIVAFKSNKPESNKAVEAEPPQATARPQSVIVNDTNLNIVMHPLPPDSLGLNEVVVTDHGKKNKAVAHVYRPQVVIDTLEPEQGYDSFDDYVADNFNLPEEYKSKTNTGEVQLSFDVDRNGQPTNITVVKSLCQKCDEEAIRLLKEGPKWKQKKDKKGKVTIKF